MSEPQTDAGRTLLLRLTTRGSGDNAPFEEAVARIEAEAAAAERARLATAVETLPKWDKRSVPGGFHVSARGRPRPATGGEGMTPRELAALRANLTPPALDFAVRSYNAEDGTPMWSVYAPLSSSAIPLAVSFAAADAEFIAAAANFDWAADIDEEALARALDALRDMAPLYHETTIAADDLHPATTFELCPDDRCAKARRLLGMDGNQVAASPEGDKR